MALSHCCYCTVLTSSPLLPFLLSTFRQELEQSYSRQRKKKPSPQRQSRAILCERATPQFGLLGSVTNDGRNERLSMYARYSREVDRVRETQKTCVQEEGEHPAQVLVNGENLQAVVDEELQRLWERLQNPPPEVHANPNCLLKRHLTPELFQELRGKKTSFGGTLKDCIKSGEPCLLLWPSGLTVGHSVGVGVRVALCEFVAGRPILQWRGS